MDVPRRGDKRIAHATRRRPEIGSVGSWLVEIALKRWRGVPEARVRTSMAGNVFILRSRSAWVHYSSHHPVSSHAGTKARERAV